MTVLDGPRFEKARASKQFRDGKFFNTDKRSSEIKGRLFSLAKEALLGRKKRIPQKPLFTFDPSDEWKKESSSGLRLTWLGHSTVLIEVDGFRILTDPVFSQRIPSIPFLGSKRFSASPVPLSGLPKLDAVLLSHNHYDHLCSESMRQIAKMDVPVVTSLGVGVHLEALHVKPQNIIELDWWETHLTRGGKLSFTATPAQHFSGRALYDRNDTLWSSWVLRTDHHQLFFSGDTGLTSEFKDIAEKFGSFDVTMLEIGAWNEAWSGIHLGPKGALSAFEMLGRGSLFPVHWGTFDLALHLWDEPIETLISLAGPEDRILTPRLGKPFEPNQIEHIDPWWRE